MRKSRGGMRKSGRQTARVMKGDETEKRDAGKGRRGATRGDEGRRGATRGDEGRRGATRGDEGATRGEEG
jgi:hypothetical protein